jgi:chlorite dismutase
MKVKHEEDIKAQLSELAATSQREKSALEKEKQELNDRLSDSLVRKKYFCFYCSYSSTHSFSTETNRFSFIFCEFQG